MSSASGYRQLRLRRFQQARIALIALTVMGGLAPSLAARTVAENENRSEQRPMARSPWHIAYYEGKYSRTNLGEILLSGRTKYEESHIAVLSLARPLAQSLWGLDFEGEGQLVRHTGIQKHLEFNGLVLARLDRPFRGSGLSLGIGEGLSLATRNPDLENVQRSVLTPNLSTETSRKLLNYLVFEVAFELPAVDFYRPEAFLRVHHRSGIFGTLCPSICGSNFVAYGVRFSY